MTAERRTPPDNAAAPTTTDPDDRAATPGPPGRPSWSGLLRLSLVTVPVKAYPAVSSSAASPFHLLHAACGQRIRYAKQCPLHGPVDGDAIVRGYEYATDQYVVVEPEELERLRPPRDKALVLEQFVPVDEIPELASVVLNPILNPIGWIVAPVVPVWV